MLLEITTLGKVTLLVVAGLFMAWALITAIWIPKRNPAFPVTLTAFVLVSSIFFVAQMGAVYWVTGTQEVEHEVVEGGEGTETEPAETEPAETEPAETEPAETEPAETQPAETEPAETEPAATEPAETEPTETETEPAETTPAEGDAAAGKDVFASAGCGTCHTLADAGASGSIGPNLDETKPSAELVVDRVTNGQGAMPAFEEQLTEQQIADVAAYVSSVAGSS